MPPTLRAPCLLLCLLGAPAALSQAPAPTPAAAKKPVPKKVKPTPAAETTAEPATDRQKILYSMGAKLGLPVASLELSEEDLVWVRQGLADSAAGRAPRVSPDAFAPQLSEFTQKRLAEVAAAQKEKDAPAVLREAARPGTVRHPTGLLFRETRAGTKPGPAATQKVFVAYTGTLTDGTVFDTSQTLGRPVVFSLDKVIPCWQNALPLMKAGGSARIVCPPELAFGELGRPPLVRPGATVVYDVELMEVLK